MAISIKVSYRILLIFAPLILFLISCDKVENRKLYPIGYGQAIINIGDADFRADSTKKLFLEGFKYYTQKKFIRARNLYLQAYQQEPTNFILLNSLANLECQISNYEEANAYFETAVTHYPKEIDTYVNFGKCLMRQEKYKEAIKIMLPHYQILLGTSINESSELQFLALCHNLAVCYDALEDCKEALQYVEIGLKYCTLADMRKQFMEFQSELRKVCDPANSLSWACPAGVSGQPPSFRQDPSPIPCNLTKTPGIQTRIPGANNG